MSKLYSVMAKWQYLEQEYFFLFVMTNSKCK